MPEGLMFSLVAIVILLIFVVSMPFLAIDWRTGQHGQLAITAVDRNLFGTYTVYARNIKSAYTTEDQEITYCIDAQDTELAEQAKSLIGKDIESTLVYPERRIGFYWFDKCHDIPVKEIIVK
jgi:hypothetical protein